MTALRLPALGPFVAKLVDQPGYANTTTPPGVHVSNDSGSFSVTFPRTAALLRILAGNRHVFRHCELMNGCVLVIGPSASPWVKTVNPFAFEDSDQ